MHDGLMLVFKRGVGESSGRAKSFMMDSHQSELGKT